MLCQSWTPIQVVSSSPPSSPCHSKHPLPCTCKPCATPSLRYVLRIGALGLLVMGYPHANSPKCCQVVSTMAMPVHPPISRAHGCPKFLHPFQISVLSIFLIFAFTVGVKYYLIVLSSSDKGFTSVVPHIPLRARMCKCLAIAWLGRNSVFWSNVLCLLSFSFPSCVHPTFRTFS